MGSIVQRTEGRYWIRWNVTDPSSGKRLQKSMTVKGTKKEAERKLREIEHAIDVGTYADPTKRTLRDFLESWLTNYVDVQVPKANTRAGYHRRLRKHVIPALGAIRLEQLSPARLQTFYRAKLEHLSPTSVNDIHRVLHRALACAVKWGEMGRNPCDLAEPPARSRTEMQVWTAAECQRFLATAKEIASRYHPLFATALYTGLRQGELLGLRWQDVDLERGSIAVVQTLEKAGREPRFGTPKTAKSRRTVPIPAELVAVLRPWKARQNEERLLLGAEYRDYNLAFALADGGPISRHNLCRRDFARIIAAAGVPRIRFHDLRHSHASLLLSAGEHPKVVSERLGHSTIAITMDVYSHVMPTLQRQASEKVAALLAAGVG